MSNDAIDISQSEIEESIFYNLPGFAKSKGVDVNDVHSWKKLCRAFYDMNEHYLAIECLDEALKLGEDLKNLYALKAIIYYQLRNYRWCINYTKRVAELDPGEFYAWYVMGECYYHVGKYGKAVKCLDRALSLRPGDEASMKVREEAFSLSQVYPDRSRSYTRKLMEVDAQEIVEAILNGTQHVAIFYSKDKIVLNPRKIDYITDASSQAVSDRIIRLKGKIRELMSQHPGYLETNYRSMMAYRRCVG